MGGLDVGVSVQKLGLNVGIFIQKPGLSFGVFAPSLAAACKKKTVIFSAYEYPSKRLKVIRRRELI